MCPLSMAITKSSGSKHQNETECNLLGLNCFRMAALDDLGDHGALALVRAGAARAGAAHELVVVGEAHAKAGESVAEVGAAAAMVGMAFEQGRRTFVACLSAFQAQFHAVRHFDPGEVVGACAAFGGAVPASLHTTLILFGNHLEPPFLERSEIG